MRKTLIAVIVTSTALFGLTACDIYGARDIDGIKRQAAFVAACEKAGGVAGYDGWGDQSCEFGGEN